jgi:hypothetical protein
MVLIAISLILDINKLVFVPLLSSVLSKEESDLLNPVFPSLDPLRLALNFGFSLLIA